MLLKSPLLAMSCCGSALAFAFAVTCLYRRRVIEGRMGFRRHGYFFTLLPLFFRFASMSPKSLPVSMVWGGGQFLELLAVLPAEVLRMQFGSWGRFPFVSESHQSD